VYDNTVEGRIEIKHRTVAFGTVIMVVRDFIFWLHKHVQNYNLFISDEDDYNDGKQSGDQTAILKQQKYTTWLYTLLFLSKSVEITLSKVRVAPILS
jgi:hypothetical protein